MAMQSTFSADDLIAEGERLSRRCLLLGPWGEGEIVGFWDGKGHQPPPKGYMFEQGESKHWISVDCAWLVEQRVLPSVSAHSHISVYERSLPRGHPAARRQPYGDHDIVVVEQRIPLQEAGIDGEPLYGREAVSFPPFEAVCLYGSPAVEAWMASFGLRRIDYGDVNLDKSEVARAYRHEWERRTPWWPEGGDGTTAVLGGWHILWPDDAFYVPPETQPAIWTLRDSEPWIELRCTPSGSLAYERIT